MASKKAGAKRGARATGAKKSGSRKAPAKRRASGARPKARASGASRKRSGGRGRGGGPPVSTLRWVGRALAIVGFVGGLWLAGWVLELDRIVRDRFEGPRFSVPSKVYSSPIVVYPGTEWQRIDLQGWLARLGYREQPEGGALEAGRYEWHPGELRVHLRAFSHPLRPEPARNLVFELGGGVIRQIVDSNDQSLVDVVVLEPEPVSAFLGSDREQRDLVSIDELPRHLVNAIFAVEDRRFEQHHGIDFRRIVGAFLANVRARRITQGASTLTQQLVKNFFLTPERTFSRKAREALMALIVEARYEKTEILEAYLNEIYLGQRGSTQVHGVGEAARLYFGKRAADLSLAESALIAAIIQSPNGISPHRNPTRARERRDLVLEMMADVGYIGDRALEEALREPLRVAAVPVEEGEVRYFLDVLSQQLPEVYDDTVLASEGLRIYSTLDPPMQRAAARALKQGLARIEKVAPVEDAPEEGLQGCLLAMRPQTGEVLALVGGRRYGVSQFNRCTQARRQVGSVFKPFVYLAGLDRSSGPAITLASRLLDEPFELETRDGPWVPRNYDDEFHGEVSVREAIERSLNIPAVKLGQQVGIDRVVAMAHKLGISSPLPRVPSLALGTAEVSPMEVARAYATLANGGRRPTPRTFVDVVESGGLAHENRPLEGSVAAVDPAAAFLGVSMLRGVVEHGTAARVRGSGMQGPIAGKTGTTDEEYDLWFVGFTPELVTVVWVGYDEPRSIGVPSSRGALPIWTEFMQEVVGLRVRGEFPRPEGVTRVEVDPLTGARAVRGCPQRTTELFLAGTEPVTTCPPGAGADHEGRPGVFSRTLRRLFGE